MEPTDLTERMPSVQLQVDRSDRREVNFLVRRPFYMNWRFGKTQNALWLGSSRRGRIGRELYNWFPFPWSECSVTLGRWSRRTIQSEIRKINERHGKIDHPEIYSIYKADGSSR